MKRLTLLAISASVIAAYAQSPVAGPQQYVDVVLNHVSSDGTWVAGCDEQEIVNILNLSTGERWDYGEPYGTQDAWVGLGHSVSDNGIVVGDGYWENGSWHKLPMLPQDYGVMANAITPDGKYIAGSVHRSMMDLDSDDFSSIPVIWQRGDDGKYMPYTVLPAPTLDWTGRHPQSILVDDISADGRVATADMVDYSGYGHQPVIFFLNDEDQWEYRLVNPEIMNPQGLVFPPFPGGGPNPPDPEDYMNSREYDNYQTALADYSNRPFPQPEDFMLPETYQAYIDDYMAYLEDPENNPYPDFLQYLTQEEYEAYENAVDEYWEAPYPDPVDYMAPATAAIYLAAVSEYEKRLAAWRVEYDKFEDVFYEVLGNTDVPSFSQNSARISPNGRYMIFTADMMYEDPNGFMGFSVYTIPYLFDLEENTYCVLDQGMINVYGTQVNDLGWVIGGAPAVMYTRDAVMAQGWEAPFEPIPPMIKEKNPDLYDWMDEYMSHPILQMGTPVATADFSTFVTWMYNSWDFSDAAPYYYSYIIPTDWGLEGIAAVDTDPVVIPEAYFDLQGRRVGTSTSGLAPGIYITSDHRKILIK